VHASRNCVRGFSGLGWLFRAHFESDVPSAWKGSDMASLADKLIKGSALRVLNPFMNVIVSLGMMPFIIHCIGDRYYGLWILASTFVGYFEFLDLGLSTANQRYIAQALGKGDHAEVNETFNTCLGLYVGTCFVALIISGIIALVTPHFVKNAADIAVFRVIIIMIGVTVALELPVSAFLGFLQAHILFDVINAIDIGKLVVRTGLILWLLGKGHGIIALAIVSLGMEVAAMGIEVVYARIRFPELPVGLRWFRREKVKPLFSYSIYSFIVKVAEAFQFQMDAFVISAFVGLGAVTHYNVGARIARYYLLFILSAIYLIMPVFSRYEGLKAYEEIREKFMFVFKLNIMMSVYVGGALLIFGKPFIGRWMGSDYLDGYPVLAILTLGLIFSTIQVTSKALLFSVSKHRFYAFALIGEGVTNLILSIIFVKKLGIFGVALGTTVPMLVNNLAILPAYTIRILGIPFSRYMGGALKTFAVSAAVMFGAWILVKLAMTGSYSYGKILFFGAFTAVLFTAVTLFTLLSKRERQYFRIPV
jgi:O-antigen/teichoic acid export membrane protein